MKKIAILSLVLLTTACCRAQYKNDNVVFKTVYTQDLCNELQKQPGYLLLDVRTRGEHEDTAMFGMNIGRFKGAKNIDVGELGKRVSELAAYKNTPVFVYCSHSQRSRRASKMLADSGFSKVFNINGGMTGLRQLPARGNECLYKMLESNNNYTMISPAECCTAISKRSKDIFLLDVRPDSAFNHISNDARINAVGSFKNTTHIALSDLETRIGNIPADKEIIVTDLFGDDAAKAGTLLKKQNYTRVSVLTEGMNRMLGSNKNELDCMQTSYISPVKYNIMSPMEMKEFMEVAKNYLFLDVRTTEEFTNKHKNSWQNIGHIANAVNIPAASIDGSWNNIASYKDRVVIIYAFSNSTVAFEAANNLAAKGFSALYVLYGGIFNIGWTAANVKGYSSLTSLREDIPAENQ